jgi:hypothetical protein
MTSPDMSVEERAELERLRRRVAELERERSAAGAGTAGPATAGVAGPGVSGRRWRTVASVLVIVVASVLAPLAVVAVWADKTVTDSDRYVETVAPLIDDPAIQNALADRITAEIFTYVDVEAVTKETFDAIAARGLPPRIAAQLDALTGPIVTGVQSFTRTQVGKIVASDAFAAAWVQANRVAHTELVNALTGQGGGTVNIANGVVSVNLAPLIQLAKQQLTAAGFGLADRIPAVNAQFVLFESADLTKVQTGFRLLDVLGIWLPILVLVLILIGVYIAESHRRAFIGAGLGIAAAMLILALALTLFRHTYLDSIPATVPHDAAATLYDTLIRFMRASLRRTTVAALIIAVAAFLTGPSTTARTTRRILDNAITALHRSAETAGLHTGAVGTWTRTYRGPLRTATVSLAAAALIIWNEPSITVILTLTAATLLILAIIEFLAQPDDPTPTPLTDPAAGSNAPRSMAEERRLSTDAPH